MEREKRSPYCLMKLFWKVLVAVNPGAETNPLSETEGDGYQLWLGNILCRVRAGAAAVKRSGLFWRNVDDHVIAFDLCRNFKRSFPCVRDQFQFSFCGTGLDAGDIIPSDFGAAQQRCGTNAYILHFNLRRDEIKRSTRIKAPNQGR